VSSKAEIPARERKIGIERGMAMRVGMRMEDGAPARLELLGRYMTKRGAVAKQALYGAQVTKSGIRTAREIGKRYFRGQRLGQRRVREVGFLGSKGRVISERIDQRR